MSPSSFEEEGGDYVLVRLDDAVESPFMPEDFEEEGHVYGKMVLVPQGEERNDGY